jgi:hypothetical protein
LVEELEQTVGSKEKYLVAGSTGCMANRGSQKGLPHAHRAQEDNVLLAFDEAQAEQLVYPIVVEGHWGIPVEALQGLLFFKASPAEALRQIRLVASIDFVL